MPKQTKVVPLSDDNANPQEELLARLQRDFPSIFTEGRIDPDKLKAACGEEILADGERYGLSWVGKSRCWQKIQEKTTKTLHPDRAQSVQFDETENVFIEGDNLEALKVLQKSYFGRVKMIYIDPPYNTGNDFIYADKFARRRDEEDAESGAMDTEGNATRADGLRANTRENGHRHSNWLNMIYPRLFLARSLLRDDGVIFVSIDDNEVANLRKVMDEIFGEENFVATFKWNKTSKAPTLSGKVRNKYEYVLCFSKGEFINFKGKASYNTMAPLLNNGNPFSIVEFPANSIECYFDDGIYAKGQYGKDNGGVEFLTDLVVSNGKNKHPIKIRGRFKWGQKTVEDRFSDGQLLAFKNSRFTTMYYLLDIGEDKFISPSDIINMEECEVQRNDEGYTELKKLFGGLEIFSYPKPTSLTKYLTSFILDKNFIVLDFFAGSGTTAHAVMQLNAEDGGNRKWISVQLPEQCAPDSEAAKAGYKTIADISRERIRRAGKKIAEEHADKQLDLGFKAFRLGDSNFKIWNTDIRDAAQLEQQMLDFIDNLHGDAAEEDVLYELLLKTGQDLNVPLARETADSKEFVRVGDGSLVICLAREITEPLFAAILAGKPEKIICFDRAFSGNDQLKTNLLLQATDAGVQEVRVI